MASGPSTDVCWQESLEFWARDWMHEVSFSFWAGEVEEIPIQYLKGMMELSGADGRAGAT